MPGKASLIPLLEKPCKLFGVKPELLAAIIETENARWDTLSMRFEPDVKGKYLIFPVTYAKENGITIITERILQDFSLGLCQIMGYKARKYRCPAETSSPGKAKLN